MLTQLLNSIRRQKGVEYEICVSDNDNTGAIKKVVDQYPGIRYQYNPIQGASENINAAIEMAAHDKIKLMMMDDIFYCDNSLKLFGDALDRHGWVMTDSVHINERGGVTGKRIAIYDPKNFDSNTVGMPSVIAFRKNHLRFYEKLKTFCDLYFYYQLYQLYGVPGKIEGFHVAQRFHNASQSRNQPASHKRDRDLLISEGKIPVKPPKVVVAVVVYDRHQNVKRWIDCWKQCDTGSAELVIIHNNDGREIDAEGVKIIRRRNVGYDVGALQDVCRNRLPGFPDYDYLLWCTDDVIPMQKDFITPFIDNFFDNAVGLTCMQLSEEHVRHVRTGCFCIKKEMAQRLIFPADPVVSKKQCWDFEHRGGRNTLLKQITSKGLRVIQVAELSASPVYDMGFPYRNGASKKMAHLLDRMGEHNKIFNSDN